MMKLSTAITLVVLFFTRTASAQANTYPRDYFRTPLDIPMQLVANFGEIRNNHWHMGLDIRTQQRVNLPVHAAADGYIARVSVEPGGFGQAIYINHPNGYTTLYGHLNAFFPELAAYVKEQQYAQQSWKINLIFQPNQFPVHQGDLIALSGSTGASEGPHVHFEIRDTKTEECLNPLLFNFPIADAVPPSVSRMALYDRSRSTYDQSPQVHALARSEGIPTVLGGIVRTGSDRISIAIGAVDRFTGSANPNGICSARLFFDGTPVTGFFLDRISYNDTRYINAQLDYPYKVRGGGSLQHLTPLPGARLVVYSGLEGGDGVVRLPDDEPHTITIEVGDANANISRVQFRVQHDGALAHSYTPPAGERFLPNNVNIFEREGFELFTTEQTIYDTVAVTYASSGSSTPTASPLFSFLSASIPAHDSVTVRIQAPQGWTAGQHIVIRNNNGGRTYVLRAQWQNGWLSARFRQFGTYQAFVDEQPPTVNAPPANLSRASRIVFTPSDNFGIRDLRVTLDGQWLRFSNDKGHSWIYDFDEHFSRGQHELSVTVEDEAGNITTRTWTVSR